MKTKLISQTLFILLAHCALYAPENEGAAAAKKVLEQKLDQPSKVEAQETTKKLFSFNYKDTPLTDVINEFAAEKKLNIILPQPQSPNALNTKLSYQLPKKVTVTQAWREVTKILAFLGYSWIPHENLLLLTKISNDIKREPLAVYKNPLIQDLPNNGTVVQTIFYLANLKLSNDATRTNIEAILKSMLSPTADIKRDDKTNAIIITDRADNIRAAMIIIKELDLEGIPDAIEVIPLYYTEAAFVEDLFKNKLFVATPSATPTRETTKQISYFPPNTKVLALGRTNAMVIMGSTKAIRTVKDFIIKYIDHPLETGESILHIYDLQYLNAEDFQGILQDLINKSVTGQAQTQGQTVGPKRDFQDVIIVAEKSTLSIKAPKKSEATQITPSETPTAIHGSESISGETQGIEQAGNRLIVAARKQDWVRIEALIKELDKPQPQVAIEVLIVDLTINNDKILGSQMRNKGSLYNSLSDNVDFQTAMIDSPVLKPAISDINTANGNLPLFPDHALMANLLRVQQGAESSFNLATEGGVGSMVISFNDPDNSGIWNVWQILDAYTNSTLLAQPFITTADNRQASITIAEQRLVDGDAVSQAGGIKTQKDDVVAATSIDILPRISVDNNNINLNIIVKVEQFLPANNNRTTRLVQTNANVGNGEVLALGGLISLNDTISDNETPLLSKIPVLGWFFKRREKNKTKNNLMIFISPRIMYPKVKGGIGSYTKDKLCFAKNELTEELAFESLRDPITRWFFKPNLQYADTVIGNFVNHEMDNEWNTRSVSRQRGFKCHDKREMSNDPGYCDLIKPPCTRTSKRIQVTHEPEVCVETQESIIQDYATYEKAVTENEVIVEAPMMQSNRQHHYEEYKAASPENKIVIKASTMQIMRQIEYGDYEDADPEDYAEEQESITQEEMQHDYDEYEAASQDESVVENPARQSIRQVNYQDYENALPAENMPGKKTIHEGIQRDYADYENAMPAKIHEEQENTLIKHANEATQDREALLKELMNGSANPLLILK